jgi:DNA-binding NarL/FixJ family response regulator
MVESDTTDWQERATELHEQGGVPERRAEVVALVERGHSHSEVADRLDLDNRANVATHVRRYRDRDREAAEWLAENGPEI